MVILTLTGFGNVLGSVIDRFKETGGVVLEHPGGKNNRGQTTASGPL